MERDNKETEGARWMAVVEHRKQLLTKDDVVWMVHWLETMEHPVSLDFASVECSPERVEELGRILRVMPRTQSRLRGVRNIASVVEKEWTRLFASLRNAVD